MMDKKQRGFRLYLTNSLLTTLTGYILLLLGMLILVLNAVIFYQRSMYLGDRINMASVGLCQTEISSGQRQIWHLRKRLKRSRSAQPRVQRHLQKLIRIQQIYCHYIRRAIAHHRQDQRGGLSTQRKLIYREEHWKRDLKRPLEII